MKNASTLPLIMGILFVGNFGNAANRADSIFTPGSVYREFRVNTAELKDGWRVTDPAAVHPGAQQFLPNAVHTIQGVHLKNATSAEVEIDFWSGHNGTRGKKIQFNNFGWMKLPEALAGAQGYSGEYLSQSTIRLAVPLKHLVEGDNTVRGTSGDNPWGWGQWGWYTIVLRVFYDPVKVEHASVELVLPENTRMSVNTFGENPTFRFKPLSRSGIRQIDLIGEYRGVDENGDGIYSDFHGMQRPNGLEGHIGTAREAPWEVTWDTRWVPDQDPAGINLLPRICDTNGIWTVGAKVAGCRLERSGYSVRMLETSNVPPAFSVRAGRMGSCVAMMDPREIELSRVSDARIYIRTWNAENNERGYTPMRINCSPWMDHITGPGHDFAMRYFTLPVEYLQTGHNLITFHSDTVHHGCEILWPGPSILVTLMDEPTNETH